MVWAEACEVGCAIVNCPNLSDLYYYHFYYDPFSDKIVPYTAYSIVCVYGPGFPKYIYHNPPYITGEPCTQCSEQSSECEDSASMHYNSPPQYQRYMRYDVTGAGAGIDEGGLCCELLF